MGEGGGFPMGIFYFGKWKRRRKRGRVGREGGSGGVTSHSHCPFLQKGEKNSVWILPPPPNPKKITRDVFFFWGGGKGGRMRRVDACQTCFGRGKKNHPFFCTKTLANIGLVFHVVSKFFIFKKCF